MFGTETGYHYKDGAPVKVGDRLSIMGTEKPATVRARMNDGKLYFYATYWDCDRTYTRSLPQISAEGFARFTGKETVQTTDVESELKTKWKPDDNGEYIFGLEEYDKAIYGNVI